MSDVEYVPVPLSYERPSEADSLSASRRYLALMRRRRSVRSFSTEPVPFSLIRNAIKSPARRPPALTSSRGRSWLSQTLL